MSESWDPISDTQWDGNSSLRTARTETFRDTYPSGSFCCSEGSAHQIAAAFVWLLKLPAAGGLSGDTWPGLRQPELSGEIGEAAYEFWQDQSHAHDFFFPLSVPLPGARPCAVAWLENGGFVLFFCALCSLNSPF